MTYSSTMIANNILSRTFADKSYVSPMKLQRILYFVAAEYQSATNQPLLEESFSTWAYGPVAYSVYDKFRNFGTNNITCYAQDARGNAFVIDETQDIHLKVSLDKVWHYARPLSAVQLSEIVRVPGSVWDVAYQNDDLCLDGGEIDRDSALGALYAASFA